MGEDGIRVDVVDLRTVRPMDVEAIKASVEKTNRAVVLEEGWEICGIGTQVVDYIQRDCFDVLDAPIDIQDRTDARPLPPVDGEVVYEQVSFRYPGAEADVLCDVSFSVQPGQTVAILGTTGAGKSTLVNLLPRFYDVTRGSVRIDGHDVREVTLDSLRGQSGIVLQEALLFGGSVRDNIAYGKPDASQAEIEAAARAAQAHAFIAELPHGYDTLVGERGIGLSGGQRQRLAIARALLKNAPILILDEATSQLDSQSEALVQKALYNLMQGRTTLVIAHRLSTVMRADRIVVHLDRRAHNPILREAKVDRQAEAIPWLEGLPMVFEYD